MLRHLIFIAGIGFLVVIAAVLYAQDRQMRQREEPTPAPAQAAPTHSPYRDSMMGRGSDWNARVLGRVREQLQVTDEEWVVLQPKIEPVIEHQRELRRGMTVWNRFGWDDGTPSPMTTALNDLRTTLASPEATPAQIAERVAALRSARADVEAQLAAARAELRAAVTDEEAAMLLLAGILD